MADAPKQKDSPEVVNLKLRVKDLETVIPTLAADSVVRKRKEGELVKINAEIAELGKR